MILPLLFFGCKIQVISEPSKPVESVDPEDKATVADMMMETDYLKRETVAGGLEYAILKSGDGIRLAEDMHVSIHYTGYLEEDLSVFDSSYDRNTPITLILGRNMVIDGWEKLLPSLHVGDIARLWIPYNRAYGEKGRGPIPPRANLVFDVEILTARDVITPEKYNVAYTDTIETDSGLQIFIVKMGAGDYPARGNVLTVHYTGYLEDGSLFDSSVQRDTPFRFVLGAGQVLRGWDEGFLYLKKGSKARLIIPANLAYGSRGSGPIPPEATLIFDVDLLDIQNN